jgi:hypothetical protein
VRLAHQIVRADAHRSISQHADARLPVSYENAKTALSACVSLDECKDWADKAEALKSYAKQANDDHLLKMATRIKDRAISRAGELLKQFDGRGGDRSKTTDDHGSAPTQRQAAELAGMSEHQQLQAVRVASIPKEQFEKLVEGDTPPTVTALAELGKKTRNGVDLNGRDPAEFNRSLHFIAEFEDYAKAIAKFDIEQILPGLIDTERQRVRAAISKIDAIHDRIITRI